MDTVSVNHNTRFSAGHRLSFSALILVVLIAATITSTTKVAAQVNTLQQCNISADDATGLSGDAAVDVHATTDYADAARRLLMEGEFDQLDCLAANVRSHKEKFSGGMWKIHLLYWGLSEAQPEGVHETEIDWQGLLANLQRWVDTKPNSVTARIALATAYTSYAWEARGNGYSNTVSGSGWQLFGERLAKARQLLDEADKLPTKCPEWFVAMLVVAQGQGWDLSEARALYERAVVFEPDYYYYYRVFANLLLPRWFGEEGDTERFAQEVADHVGGDRGDALYFQIASNVICGCSGQPKMSWQRIARGSDALEKLEGPSILNLNFLAKMAIQRGYLDVFTADKAFTRIGNQWDEGTWKTKEYFDKMKAWVATVSVPVKQRHALEDVATENEKTPDGVSYKAAFERKYQELVKQCITTYGNDITQMESLTNVGAKGTVDDFKVYYPNSTTAACVERKLNEFRVQRTSLFPTPPHEAYWVRLDLTKSDFSPLVAK